MRSTSISQIIVIFIIVILLFKDSVELSKSYVKLKKYLTDIIRKKGI